MKIGVFCSANNNIDPDFFECTEELGRWIGEHHYAVAYGGCNIGLMECIGRSVHEAGGTTIGIVPRIIEKGGKKSDYIDIEFLEQTCCSAGRLAGTRIHTWRLPSLYRRSQQL